MTEPERRPGDPYCSSCGYSLTGAVDSSKCPECGLPLVEVLVRHQVKLNYSGKRFRATTKLLGLPLIDIALGPVEGEAKGKARGFIAIGDEAVGWLAIGGFARGFVAIGGFALGVLSMGGMSIGLLGAVGGAAIGGFAAQVMQFMAQDGLLENGLKFRPLTLPDHFIDHDKPAKQVTHAGLDAAGIVPYGLK